MTNGPKLETKTNIFQGHFFENIIFEFRPALTIIYCYFTYFNVNV